MGCAVVKTRPDAFLEADWQSPYKLDDVEAQLKQLYKNWSVMMSNNEQLTKEKNQVAEELEVMNLAVRMMGDAGKESGGDVNKPLLRMLNAVAGVINTEDQVRFSRAVWRSSRGNTFVHFCSDDDAGNPITMADPKDGKTCAKSVFVIFFQGSSETQSTLRDRILKVCSTFGASTYAWSDSAQGARTKKRELEKNLQERQATLSQCEDHIRAEASMLVKTCGAGRSSLIEEWRTFCVKEKSIYAVLNMFEGTTHLRANIWFAESEESTIQQVLQNTRGANSEHAAHLHPVANSKKEPPTYIRTNDFTEPWQVVINTYGVPRYQEANPALFACVTFPFIFGMMYGDVGHGTCLTCFGAYLCMKGKDLLKIEGFGETLYWCRFLVLQLGIYATFAGFMYNDLFSIGLQLFDTRYKVDAEGNYFPDWDYRNEGNGK